MADFKISRYIVKKPGTEFIELDSSNEQEMVIRNNYLDFTRSLDGRISDTVVRSTINENTVKLTWDMRVSEDKQEIIGRRYIREIGKSSNTAVVEYQNLLKSKGDFIDVPNSYWEIEYSNGHVQAFNFPKDT